jgi:tetratricopeptide (TPR) repeat protein
MQNEEFYKLVENPGLLSEETLPELEGFTQKFPYFQVAWMLYLKNLTVTGHDGFEAALKKGAVAVPDRKKLHRFLYSDAVNQTSGYYFEQAGILQRDQPDGETNESEKGGSLIDKFLSSEPAPIRMDSENTNETREEDENEIMEKSVSESDELITETLAMIYFEQKKYDKALDAFKKLSLKYPEKSVYFATRIEEIEKLKNI